MSDETNRNSVPARPRSRAAVVAAALAAATGIAGASAVAQTRTRQPAPSDQLAPEAEGSDSAEGSAPTVEERPATVFYGVMNNDIRGTGGYK